MKNNYYSNSDNLIQFTYILNIMKMINNLNIFIYYYFVLK